MSSTTADVNDLIDDEEGLSGFTILAILATVVVVFILVVMYAYRQGVATGSTLATEELPVVAADPRPVAEDVPLAGGNASNRQEVYDRVSGALPSRIVTAEDPARDALNGYGGAPQTRQPSTAAAVRAEEPPVRATTPAASTQTAATTPTQTAPSASAQRTVPAPSRKPVVAQRETTPPPVGRTAPAATTTAAVVATHVVQVGAFDSDQAALNYFDQLAGRLGGLLSGKRPDIQRATVNGRVYHRLRIGPFTSKSDATAYCNQLKTRGQDCLVRGV
ncbi:MAG: SPOR domain-containing protein [Pseudomonadota bacterium]